MQKLSRIDKYKDYRNKINNDSERDISTKELKELQEKIIFNEKRFGNSSRTETDLQRGRKDTSYDDLLSNFDYPRNPGSDYTNNNYQESHTSDLDDIFTELNKYKNFKQEDPNDNDDYIKRIKDVVYRTSENQNAPRKDTVDNKPIAPIKREEPIYNPNYEDDDLDVTDLNKNAEIKQTSNENIEHSNSNLNDFVFEEIAIQPEKTNPQEIEEQEIIKQEKDELNIPQESKTQNQLDENKIPEIKNDTVAEFEEQPVIRESQIKDVVLEKPKINIPVPKQDHSKEFEEICATANTLAEEIESSDSFAKGNVRNIANHSINTSLAGVQQDIKKELINTKEDNIFLNSLKQEVEEYNKNEQQPEAKKVVKNDVDNQKRVIKKSEVSGQLKEEFDNTVSLEVDKLRSEINASKADNISANEIIKNSNLAKQNISEDHPGKTIAFEFNKNDDIPDNTIVLSQPSIEDSSIHTMSFKTEDLDIEKDDKSNTMLNIILSILIIIAVVALGLIIYFFLITRGII